MKNIKVNGVNFRGQFGVAYEYLIKGHEITMNDFKNGSWEATSKISRFVDLLNQANVKYTKSGESLRTTVLKIEGVNNGK